MTRIMREFPRPLIEVEPTDYGLRVVTLRRISDAHTHVRVTNLVFPNAFVIPMSSEMTITQWHVPIDDHNSMFYGVWISQDGSSIDHAAWRGVRMAPEVRAVFFHQHGQLRAFASLESRELLFEIGLLARG